MSPLSLVLAILSPALADEPEAPAPAGVEAAEPGPAVRSDATSRRAVLFSLGTVGSEDASWQMLASGVTMVSAPGVAFALSHGPRTELVGTLHLGTLRHEIWYGSFSDPVALDWAGLVATGGVRAGRLQARVFRPYGRLSAVLAPGVLLLDDEPDGDNPEGELVTAGVSVGVEGVAGLQLRVARFGVGGPELLVEFETGYRWTTAATYGDAARFDLSSVLGGANIGLRF